MDINCERAAFEAWVSASGRAHLLGRDGPHSWYKDLTVAAWWSAWQARAANDAAQLTDGKILDIAEDFKTRTMSCGISVDEFDSIGFARALIAANHFQPLDAFSPKGL